MPWYDKFIFWGRKTAPSALEVKDFDELQHPPRPASGPRSYFEYFTEEGPVGVSWSVRAYIAGPQGIHKVETTAGIGNDMAQARKQAQEAGHSLLKEYT